MSQSTYTLKCLERAVAFMSDETRKGHTPQLEDIANAAGLSKFHFNRVYRLATGETPQETLTRFKLARATEQLRDPNVTITQAAFSAGYGSSQSFAKALKRVLSTSASAIRVESERLSSAIETLTIRQSEDGGSRADLSVEIAKIEPFEAITIRTDGTYPVLNAIYGALFEAAGRAETVEAILGRPFGDIGSKEPGALRFDCSLKLVDAATDLPDNVTRSHISGGLFLLTRHIGAYELLPDAIDRLYLTALSEDGARIADEPLLFHYLDDPETTAVAALRTDIYLPLQAK